MYDYKIFTSYDCPEELFSFRYKVYVEEMNRRQTDADHERRVIKDELDKTAHHAVVFHNNSIVACMRVNFLREGSVGKYNELYDLHRLIPMQVSTASICTRLMVDPEHRRNSVTVRILQFIYIYGLKNNIETCVMDCNRPLRRFFEKFGYRHLFDRAHPEYGRVSVMNLDLLDIEYLRNLNSPFAVAFDIAQRNLPNMDMVQVAAEFNGSKMARCAAI